MLMTPDPTNRFGERRLTDGGLRGKVRIRQYERSLEKPATKDENTAQPNRYDVMRAPVYEQRFAAPVRAGAMDFKNVPSKTFSQRDSHE